MPTYDYVCDACGHAFEEFQMMSAKPLTTCPECKKKKLRRLIGTGAGVIFKGGGFYETDYRSDSYAKDAKKDKPAESKSDGKKSGDAKASGGETKGGSGAKKSSGDAAAKKPAAKPKGDK